MSKHKDTVRLDWLAAQSSVRFKAVIRGSDDICVRYAGDYYFSGHGGYQGPLRKAIDAAMKLERRG